MQNGLPVTSAPLTIRLFGQPTLTVGDAVYKLQKSRRTLPILAYLLLHRGKAIARDFLAYTVSPDEDEESAVASLRRHLYELGKSLPAAPNGRPWIAADSETLQWNTSAAYCLDVADFERASADPSSLSEAIDLYGGDLVETLYDDWIFPHRERLRSTFLTCLSQSVAQFRERRDFARAIEYTRRLLVADPWREDAVRQLMMLQYEVGDRAGALHAYEQFGRSLREEMAVEPMPETIALRETLVRDRFVSGGIAIECSAPSAARRFSLPFVGREAELEQLRQSWHRSARGRGSVSLLSGEAGIGKSRLVGELISLVQAEGGRVLFGSAKFPEPAPYSCIADALRSGLPLVAAANVQPIWLAALSRIVPEFRVRRTDLPPLAQLDPNRERQRLFEALSNCVAAVSRPRPLLVVLEDLHWAGASTIDALRFLAWRLVEMPVMLVATFREEEIVRGHPLRVLRRELRENRAHTGLSLRGLDRSAVALLASDVPSIDRHVDDFSGWLYAQSDGNPFFVAQLIADLRESGGDKTSVPNGVREMVLARLARLSPQARRTAEVAAVAGSGFSIGLISEVAGTPEYEVLDAVGELLDRHIVRETFGRGGSDYSFGHQLIASAIYDAMPSEQRRLRHRRIARALQDGDAPAPDLLVDIAFHYDRSGECESAAQHYLVAARHMHERFAGEESLTLLRRALDLGIAPPLQFEMNLLAAKVHARRGDRRAEREAVENLERLTRDLARPDARCGAHLARVALLHALGHRDEEAQTIVAFAKSAEIAGDEWRAEAAFARADLDALTGRLEAAKAAVEHAAKLYRHVGNARGDIRCMCIRGAILTQQGRFRDADESLERARRGALTLGDAPLAVRALRSAGAVATTERDFTRSKRIGEEMLALAREVGDREGEADGHAAIAAASGLLFDIEVADGHYAEAARLYRSLRNRQGQGIVAINAAMLRYAVGDVEKAHADLHLAVRLFEEIGDARNLTIAVLNLARVLLDCNRPEEALERAEQGASLARQSQSTVLEAHAGGLVADAHIASGNLADSIAQRRLALELQRRVGPALAVAGTLADLAWSLAEFGDANGAVAAANEVRMLGDVCPADILAPSVLWSVARMYRSIGDLPSFRRELGRAHALFVERAAAMPSASLRSSYAKRAENASIEEAYSESANRAEFHSF